MELLPDITEPRFCSAVQYRDGYQTGFDWSDTYTPGGPYVFRESIARLYDDEKTRHRIKAAQLSREAHDAWHRGFKAGIRARNLASLILPKRPRRNVRSAA